MPRTATGRARRRHRTPLASLTILGAFVTTCAAFVQVVDPGGRAPSTAGDPTAVQQTQGTRRQAPPLAGQGDHVAPGGNGSAPPLAGAGLDRADGVIPSGAAVSVFDSIPAVERLDPDLLDALRKAAREAAASETTFQVNSGWRSTRYQQRLLDDAVAQYGSLARARRWVATPERSAHVSGDAVDIGPSPAAAWLSAHGDAHGLCQIYRNEPWHFELRSSAMTHGCPKMYASPAEDPRMRP